MGKGRSAENHYCMSVEDIAALHVSARAADDAVLLLWTTDPLLEKALDVIRALGFVYKTVDFYRAKLNKSHAELFDDSSFSAGLGFWTRANPEMCLLATRGKRKRKSAGVRKLIVSPRREHSRKPDEGHARIEALLDSPYPARTRSCARAIAGLTGTPGARRSAA